MKSFTEFSQLRQWMVLGFRWILDCLSYCMIVNPGCFLSWVCFPLWRMQVERWPKWAVWPWWKRSAEVIYLPVWLCRSVVGWTLNCGGGDSGVQCGELIDKGVCHSPLSSKGVEVMWMETSWQMKQVSLGYVFFWIFESVPWCGIYRFGDSKSNCVWLL